MTHPQARGWINDGDCTQLCCGTSEGHQQQEEENQEQLNESYRILTGFAPEAAEKLIELIRSPRTRDYVRKDAIRDYFQIIEKGVTEKRQAEMMQEMMEKLHALEGGRVLDI